jgi:hypothetical protein
MLLSNSYVIVVHHIQLVLAGQLMQERTELHKVGVDTVALHPSQALVATGGADRLIKLWPCHSQVRAVSMLTLPCTSNAASSQKRLSCTNRLLYMQLDSCVLSCACTCMKARRAGVTFDCLVQQCPQVPVCCTPEMFLQLFQQWLKARLGRHCHACQQSMSSSTDKHLIRHAIGRATNLPRTVSPTYRRLGLDLMSHTSYTACPESHICRALQPCPSCCWYAGAQPNSNRAKLRRSLRHCDGISLGK